jgi:hypothetical protein
MNSKWLLLMIGIFLLWNTTVQAQTLKLEISLSKAVYLEGEPVWLDATLTNISSDTVRIWGMCLSCQYGFIVELKNEKDKILPYKGVKRNVILGPGFIIRPKEIYYECFDLVQAFSQERSLSRFFLTAIYSGKYRLKAKYGLWKGEVIESNEISFEIKSPTGEEAKAYKFLIDAHQNFCAGKDTLMRQSLDRLLTQFPKSIYAEKACQLLFERKDLLEKFPDSGFTQTSLDVLTFRMTEEKKQEYLQTVIKKYPKTRSAKFAQQMLQGW